VEWYRRAAEQGEPTAQYLLGLMYDKGQGVPQDQVLAQKWLILAAAHASGRQREYYARIRDAVAFKLSPAQIREAQDLAAAFTEVRER
jgi:TPR repeat protein